MSLEGAVILFLGDSTAIFGSILDSDLKGYSFS